MDGACIFDRPKAKIYNMKKERLWKTNRYVNLQERCMNLEQSASSLPVGVGRRLSSNPQSVLAVQQPLDVQFHSPTMRFRSFRQKFVTPLIE
jgi:hypothetical protein